MLRSTGFFTLENSVVVVERDVMCDVVFSLLLFPFEEHTLRYSEICSVRAMKTSLSEWIKIQIKIGVL